MRSARGAASVRRESPRSETAVSAGHARASVAMAADEMVTEQPLRSSVRRPGGAAAAIALDVRARARWHAESRRHRSRGHARSDAPSTPGARAQPPATAHVKRCQLRRRMADARESATSVSARSPGLELFERVEALRGRVERAEEHAGERVVVERAARGARTRSAESRSSVRKVRVACSPRVPPIAQSARSA